MDSLLLRRRMLLGADSSDFLSLPYFCSDSEIQMDSELLEYFLNRIDSDEFGDNRTDLRNKPYYVTFESRNTWYLYYAQAHTPCYVFHDLEDVVDENNDSLINAVFEIGEWGGTPFRFDSYDYTENVLKLMNPSSIKTYCFQIRRLEEPEDYWAGTYSTETTLLFGDPTYVHTQNTYFDFYARNNYPIYTTRNFSITDSIGTIGRFIFREDTRLPYKTSISLPASLSMYQEVWNSSDRKTPYPNVSLANEGTFAYNAHISGDRYDTIFGTSATAIPVTNKMGLYNISAINFDTSQNRARFYDSSYIYVQFKNKSDGSAECVGVGLNTDAILFADNPYPIYTTSTFTTLNDEEVIKPNNTLPYTVNTNLFTTLSNYQTAWNTWRAGHSGNYPSSLSAEGSFATIKSFTPSGEHDGVFRVHFYVPNSTPLYQILNKNGRLATEADFEDFEVTKDFFTWNGSGNYTLIKFDYDTSNGTVTCEDVDTGRTSQYVDFFGETTCYPVYVSGSIKLNDNFILF